MKAVSYHLCLALILTGCGDNTHTNGPGPAEQLFGLTEAQLYKKIDDDIKHLGRQTSRIDEIANRVTQGEERQRAQDHELDHVYGTLGGIYTPSQPQQNNQTLVAMQQQATVAASGGRDWHAIRIAQLQQTQEQGEQLGYERAMAHLDSQVEELRQKADERYAKAEDVAEVRQELAKVTANQAEVQAQQKKILSFVQVLGRSLMDTNHILLQQDKKVESLQTQQRLEQQSISDRQRQANEMYYQRRAEQKKKALPPSPAPRPVRVREWQWGPTSSSPSLSRGGYGRSVLLEQ